MGSLPELILSGPGTSNFVLAKMEQNPQWQAAPEYALGLIVTVSPGASLVYSVQVTGDQFPSNTGFWNDHQDFSGLTVSQNGNVGYPITAYRLSVPQASYVSGSVHLGVARWP